MKSVLLIDDQLDIATFFGQLLEMNGYQVTIANGATDGLQKLKRQRFDAVICDNYMPVMFGTEIALENIHGSPFILMTGESDLRGKIFPGVDQILFKPFEFEHLLQLVHLATTASAPEQSKAA